VFSGVQEIQIGKGTGSRQQAVGEKFCDGLRLCLCGFTAPWGIVKYKADCAAGLVTPRQKGGMDSFPVGSIPVSSPKMREKESLNHSINSIRLRKL